MKNFTQTKTHLLSLELTALQALSQDLKALAEHPDCDPSSQYDLELLQRRMEELMLDFMHAMLRT